MTVALGYRSFNETVPYRVFGPETLMSSMTDIHRYIPQCLTEVTAVLGPHPMKRQDILVVPSSFDSLGMARSDQTFYLLLHSQFLNTDMQFKFKFFYSHF